MPIKSVWVESGAGDGNRIAFPNQSLVLSWHCHLQLESNGTVWS